MTGSGEAIFDWKVVNDEVNGSEAIESQLGLKRGALEGPAAGWLDVLHPLDRDRYTLALDGLLHQRSGRINHELDCADRTATISGTCSKPGRWSAPTARWCESSAHSRT